MNGQTSSKNFHQAERDVEVAPPHLSVLYQEVLSTLQPDSGKRYLDGTLGAGGHAEGILAQSSPAGELLGLDVDPVALQIARQRLAPYSNRVHIEHASYTDAKQVLNKYGWHGADGIILDLGVSSMQIDQAQRGFSFQKTGQLDMRFDQSQGQTASDLINTLDETTLADIIWRYGEERFSRRIAAAIVTQRPIHATEELADVIRKAVGNHNTKIDPATRSFQALRIAVNKELTNLEKALPDLVNLLVPGGRMAVISFHSLEDRLVKLFFKRESSDCICPPEVPVCSCGHKASLRLVNRRPIMATDDEVRQNPRSRSAKLRVAEKVTLTQVSA